MIPKFRGWIKSKKEMHDVLLIDWLNGLVDLAYSNIELDFDDVIFMQSTGLKDKNGVEIFEGDIVDVGTRIPFLNKIQRDEETAYLKLVPLDKRWTESYFTNFEDKSRYEVIGNIYENKELLEKYEK